VLGWASVAGRAGLAQRSAPQIVGREFIVRDRLHGFEVQSMLDESKSV
jgi:hypothetical protein